MKSLTKIYDQQIEGSVRTALALIPLVLLCIFYLYKAVDFPIHDFANYYFGAAFLADGNFTSDIYFPYYFNKSIVDLGYSGIFVSYAPNTPFLAFLFYPFSVLSPEAAKLLFNLISCALLSYSLYRLAVFYKIRILYILLIPVIFFVPIKNNLLFGQLYFLIFFLLAESLLAYENKQFFKMAVLLSFGIILKVFPVIFLLMLIFRKQFRVVAYVMVFCALLFFVSAAVSGIDVWVFWLSKALPKAAVGEIAGAYVDNYQSVLMFLKRAFVFDPNLNPDAFMDNPALVPALLFGFKTLVIFAGWFITIKNNNLVVFGFWIMASIVLSPYGSTYTFVLLLISFFGISNSRLSLMKQFVLVGLLFAVNNIPLSMLAGLQFPFSYGRLALLLALLFVFIALLATPIKWKIVMPIAFLFTMLVFIFSSKSSTGQKHVLKNAPILIYDYQLSNNRLTYFYWDEKGENRQSIPFANSKAIPLKLKDNQIYNTDIRLTSDNSNKLKPLLVNDNSIILLSDSDRGIGFYTLKIIDLNKNRKP